ncbi:beta-2-glycoprotein 1-like [Embiotoca jacksoni]|uniref:beta-2-glycoprotein 1-like n=1 Tax=Embiotoca jacksoni TaxID=100190 RepID=UPI0037039F73
MEHMLTFFLLFFTIVTSKQDNVCSRPNLGGNVVVAGLQRYFNPGDELVLSCEQGYTPSSGPRTIVCTTSGHWTINRFMCKPKQCPYPEPLFNGQMYYENTMYQSTINYTCDEGYILTGSSSVLCQADGTWSTPAPDCTPVKCGVAPVPQFGMIIYDQRVGGNTTDYGIAGTYKCLPPYALVGSARAECTASGTWTKTPECRVVTCPPPQNINRGYMSSSDQRDYDYMETIKYGCNGDYVLDGGLEIVCQQDGTWSEKPSCKGPCHVSIQRGRILYKGRKIWIEDFHPNRVLHKEIVSVYCKNKARNCGYAVSIQCIDGRLKIPDCFERPGHINYRLNSDSLPSEIEQC